MGPCQWPICSFELQKLMMYLIAHKGLLDSSEVLQGCEKHVPILWTAHILYKAAQLVAESCQHLVFIFY